MTPFFSKAMTWVFLLIFVVIFGVFGVKPAKQGKKIQFFLNPTYDGM
jgi:ABC-type multidrug transport system permease subunit